MFFDLFIFVGGGGVVFVVIFVVWVMVFGNVVFVWFELKCICGKCVFYGEVDWMEMKEVERFF